LSIWLSLVVAVVVELILLMEMVRALGVLADLEPEQDCL
jgi:hypothetical protein